MTAGFGALAPRAPGAAPLCHCFPLGLCPFPREHSLARVPSRATLPLPLPGPHPWLAPSLAQGSESRLLWLPPRPLGLTLSLAHQVPLSLVPAPWCRWPVFPVRPQVPAEAFSVRQSQLIAVRGGPLAAPQSSPPGLGKTAGRSCPAGAPSLAGRQGTISPPPRFPSRRLRPHPHAQKPLRPQLRRGLADLGANSRTTVSDLANLAPAEPLLGRSESAPGPGTRDVPPGNLRGAAEAPQGGGTGV